MNRLQEKYQKEILPALQKELGIKNTMAVPRIEKIVLNMGMGDAAKDKTIHDKIMGYMSQIAGQKPQFRHAKKSIAEFNMRQGDPVGIRVTLRGIRMYEFFDKLVSVVLPRLRDFQGVSLKAFDNQGNYNLGLSEQIVFPEVVYDTIDRVRGLQITIKTTATNPKSALLLLKQLGMPFEKDKEENK